MLECVVSVISIERDIVSDPSACIVELARWFETDPGRYVQAWEQQQFEAMVMDVFGYHALQVGFPQMDLLTTNRIPFKAYSGVVQPEKGLSRSWSGCVVAQAEALPFDTSSVDLLVLPHGLECTDDPHQVLREVHRVLVPEGRVVLSGFNPWSLWGFRHHLPWIKPWLPQPAQSQVSVVRLKDWFKLLSFDIDRGRFGCYVPPCRTEKWIQRHAFMEKAGDRWWPVCGAVYVVSAVKKVAGMRLITPAWKRKMRRRGARAAAGVAAQQTSWQKSADE